ncbi:MAG: GNAT family N-acetyltransferase [Anaerolineae bacterium]|nr:GNAT family N-acetyltransferase [Anaerolineae bacterium]
MLSIRPYQPADEATVWELHVLPMQQVGAYLGDGPWDDDLRDIQGAYFDNGGVFLVGDLEGRTVAMGALRRVDAECAEIKRMRTHPDFQGRGFGKDILRALEAEAIRLGYTALILETSVVQHAAQHMYRQHGFIETHRGKVEHMDCIWFKKHIQ